MRSSTDLTALAVAELGPALGPAVARVLRAAEPSSAEDWIPHPAWPFGSRRKCAELARSGAIEGVRRLGEGKGVLYLARRSALDAYIETHGRLVVHRDDKAANDRAPEAPTSGTGAVLHELGFEAAPPRAAKGRR
jgi:hypothetical protein